MGSGSVRIFDRRDRFADRAAAGRELASKLSHLRGRDVVVLGIPRGGLVVAREVAQALDAELDIVLAQKLGAPSNPELAIGTVSEDGTVVIDERLASMVGADARYLEREKERVRQSLATRAALCRALRPKVALTGRTVIVVDDGVATGATTKAALTVVRNEKPARLIAATPVGPPATVYELADFADEVVCLWAPPWFEGVGQFYDQFAQTEDNQLLEILEHSSGGQRR